MFRICLSLALLLLTFNASYGQEGLIEIYDLAVRNDPAIREAEANLFATSETRRQARSSLLPQLSLSASSSDNTNVNPNPPLDFISGEPSTFISSTESESESTNLSLSLSQTLFDWGQFMSLRQADKIIARAETDYAVAQQDLMLRVASAYFNVLAAEDLLAADVAAREALGQQLEQTERQNEVGLIPITDVQEARAGYDRAVASVIASERTLATARESLREIISDYVTDLQSPVDNLPLVSPDPDDIEVWVEMAQGQNLALISSRLAADVAEDDINISRSSRFPTLRLQASESDASSSSSQTNNLFSGGAVTIPNQPQDREGTSLSLNLSVPIFTGGANRSRIQQSVFRHRAAIQTVERITRQTERLTRDAYLGVVAEIRRVQALRQSLESSRLALEATLAAEEVGQRTRVDVVNAQNNVRQAETTYAGARYDYLLNILQLKQAAGNLTVEDLAEIDDWLE